MWVKIIFLFALSYSTYSADLKVLYTGFQVLETGSLQSDEHVGIVQGMLGLETRDVLLFEDSVQLGKIASLLVSPKMTSSVKEILKSNNIPYRLTNEDYQRTLDRHARQNEEALAEAVRLNEMYPASFLDHTAYMTYEEQSNWLYSKAAASDLAVNWAVGQTAQGRDILAFNINYLDSVKPMIWLDANMRGCDWITSATAIYIIDQILNGDSTDAAYLRANFRFIIIPNSNPDGYEYSRLVDRMWVKNRSLQSGVTNSSCMGVNLNRNWNIIWDGSTNSDPCYDDFRGPQAMSELETQALNNMIQQLPSLKIFITMQAFNQKWMTPYGSGSYLPADYNELMRVANMSTIRIATVNDNDATRKFDIGTVFSFYGQVSGSEVDFVKARSNTTYTYQLRLRPLTAGDGGVDIPPDQIIKSGQEILAGLAECCRQARVGQFEGK